MVRYYTRVANELLPGIMENKVEGLRFVQVRSIVDSQVSIVELEDNNASEEMAGKLVTPVLQETRDLNNKVRIRVMTRAIEPDEKLFS